MKIKAVDVFSGCGGVSCGLTESGFEVSCAVEILKSATETYSAYHKLSHVKVLNKDVHEVSGQEILDSMNLKKDEIFLFAGCPPCQNFSFQNNSRKNKTKEAKQALLLEFLRLIKETNAPFVLMENVPGIVKSENGEIFTEFINELKNEKNKDLTKKYFVVYKIVNAADYGVPQRRKRFVLHAVRKDIYNFMRKKGVEFIFPYSTHSASESDGKIKWITVGEAIGDLPEIKAGEKYTDEKIFNHYAAGLSVINLKRMKHIRKTGGSRESLPDDLSLACHKTHKGHKDVYGIMDSSLPAPTLTGGCTSYSKGRFGHPTQNRAISVREAARIQTFPDDFKFNESITKASLEIGNAVPVKLVKSSGDFLLKYIKEFIGVLR